MCSRAENLATVLPHWADEHLPTASKRAAPTLLNPMLQA